MMRITIISIALMVMTNSALADCKVALQKGLEKDLDLSYKQFDQTKDSGFRLLEQSGCYAEAATLIKRYIAHNNSKESSLTWHLAQMEGLAGNYQQAIFQAKKVLKPKENLSEFPMYWNDFVLGNIAFWSNDKEMLKKHMVNIEQGVSFKPNQINLNYLNQLLTNFNSSYLQALKGN